MSLLIVTPDIVGPIKNGGIGTACYHYARSCANAGVETSILYTTPIDNLAAGIWKDWYQKQNIQFYTLGDVPELHGVVYGMRWHSERSYRVMQFLREKFFRLVLFQDWQANGFWAVRAKKLGQYFHDTTFGIISHSPNQWQKEGMQSFGSDPLAEASQEWEEKEAIAAADVLISPSRHMIQWLSDHDYPLPKRVLLAPYTFEDTVFKRRTSVDAKHLIFFGRLETRKGLHLLGDALRGLKSKNLALPRQVSLLGKYATVNGMPTEEYIEYLVRDIPEIEFSVHTNFDYAQAVEYIRATSGLVIIASTLDNFPLTVIESITNGFPFLASRVGGIPEMVDERILFHPSVAGLEEKLAGVERIEFDDLKHLYDPSGARQTWLAHVDELLSGPPSSATIAKTKDGVSVCIPFYKFDRFLPRLIGSFLRDRDENFQLVFVNDGTQSEEAPNFYAYKKKLEPIGHVFAEQDNKGAGAARNRAVELARYDKIIFFDADNVPINGFVAKLRESLYISRADSVAAPFLATNIFLRQPLIQDAIYTYLPPGGPLVSALTDNQLGDTCSIQKRHVFEKLGGFKTDRRYYDDWEYFIRLVGNGFQHLVFPEPLFYYAHDPAGRRSMSSEFKNRVELWDDFEALSPSHLSEMLSVLARHVHVKK